MTVYYMEYVTKHFFSAKFIYVIPENLLNRLSRTIISNKSFQ